jgi:hypothetical protein
MFASAKWQERRDAFETAGRGEATVSGSELAKAVEKEANAAVFEAALDATKLVLERDDSTVVSEALENGILGALVARGVASTRVATARRGMKTDNISSSSGASFYEL